MMAIYWAAQMDTSWAVPMVASMDNETAATTAVKTDTLLADMTDSNSVDSMVDQMVASTADPKETCSAVHSVEPTVAH